MDTSRSNGQVPPPAPENFDKAGEMFNRYKPVGTRIAGLAIIQSMAQIIFWSVNYEVDTDSQFPKPTSANCVAAKAKFQSAAPTNTSVHECVVCEIKPGGLVVSKWQVQYSVKMTGSSDNTNLRNRRIGKDKQPIKSNLQRRTNNEKARVNNSNNDLRNNKVTMPNINKKIAFVKATSESTRRATSPKENEHILNQILSTTARVYKETKQLQKKYRDVFISKTNVFKYDNNEINKWFSRKKKNFSFGLKRIMNKHRRQEKTTEIKQIKVQEENLTKTDQINKQNKEEEVSKPQINLIDPKQLYENIEAQRLMKVFTTITSNDKMLLLGAIRHVLLSRNCKYQSCTSRQVCVTVSELLRKYDMIDSDEVYDKFLKAAKLRYKIDDTYLDALNIVDIKLQHSPNAALLCT